MRRKLRYRLARLSRALSEPPRYGIGWLEGVVGVAAAVGALVWLTLPPRLPTPGLAPVAVASASAHMPSFAPAVAPRMAPAEATLAALALTLPALRPPPRSVPAWLRYSVAAPAAHGRPRVALVIDDLGVDKKRSWRTIGLKGPMTLSFLAYASDLPEMTQAARRAGHELLLHVPMEPISPTEDMGPNGLAVGLGSEEVLRRLRWDLGRFEGYVGINNHMGSRFTSDAPAMTPVMEELKARGLLFVDSRTTSASAGIDLARRFGVPNAARDVFLDNEVDAPAIAEQLAEVERVARHHGSAIAIGHPHDATLDALEHWIRDLPKKGLVLVPVSAIVRERWQETRGAAGGTHTESFPSPLAGEGGARREAPGG